MRGIVVNWLNWGLEFLPIDNEKPHIAKFSNTHEIWPERRDPVNYQVIIESVQKDINGRTAIKIRYLLENNVEISKITKENPFGLSTIVVKHGALSGYAYWEGSSSRENQVGKSRWYVGTWAEVLREKEEEVVRRAKRCHKLRSRLLKISNSCAITGETLVTALDAAHLVAVNQSGVDHPNNSILLRADLHRLLDAKLFNIDAKGRFGQFSQELPSNYRKLLEKTGRLTKADMSRVKSALERRNGHEQKL